VNGSGTLAVEYAYNAWGKPMGVTGSMATTLGAANPFRYRGYYYDAETGLYYLNSRYYNPNWGRFLNADSVFGKAGGLLTHNLFAYCGNDPVMASDPSGNFWYYGNTQQSNSTSFEQAKKADLLHKIKHKTKNQAIIAAIEAGEKGYSPMRLLITH